MIVYGFLWNPIGIPMRFHLLSYGFKLAIPHALGLEARRFVPQLQRGGLMYCPRDFTRVPGDLGLVDGVSTEASPISSERTVLLHTRIIRQCMNWIQPGGLMILCL